MAKYDGLVRCMMGIDRPHMIAWEFKTGMSYDPNGQEQSGCKYTITNFYPLLKI